MRHHFPSKLHIRSSVSRRPGFALVVTLLGPLATLFLLAGTLPSISPSEVHAQEPSPDQGAHSIFLPTISRDRTERHLGAPDLGASASVWAGLPEQALPTHHGWPAGRSYTVQSGDTLLTVALEMGMDLDQLNCLLSPAFAWTQPLVIGDTLTVPEQPFICHHVQEGESVAQIAQAYGASEKLIWLDEWNNLDKAPMPGQNLRVPLLSTEDSLDGVVPVSPDLQTNTPPVESHNAATRPQSVPQVPSDWPYGSGEFAWPVYGWLTQGYHVGHSAIDVAAVQGTPVTAADRGVVIRAGWSTVGYGKFVVVDHNIDYITLYAHLDEIYVEEGDVVARGQLLGNVGSTGNSTGPHLHFEIRDFGKRVDPLTLLPQ